MLRKNSRLGLGAIPGLLEKGPNRGQYLTTFITWRNVQGPTSLRPTAKSMAPVTSAASTRGPGPAVSGKRARVSRPCGGAGGGMVEPVKEPPLRRAVRVIALEPVRELRCQAKRAELNAVSTGTRNSVKRHDRARARDSNDPSRACGDEPRGSGKGAVRPRAAGSVLRPPSVSRPRCPAGSDEQKEQRPSGQERGERAGAVCAKSFP